MKGDKVQAMNEPEVLEAPRSVRWEAVEFLAAKNAQDIAAPQPNLPFILVAWFIEVAMFHEAECEKIIGGTPTAQERQAHKQLLAMLIWQGESLISCLRERESHRPVELQARSAHEQGVVAQAGVTLADVEATLEELYDRQRVFYGGMTEARRAQILDEVFSAS